MNKIYNIEIFDLLICLSEIMDWISPELNNHHRQVAMMSVLLARSLKLSQEEINDIVCAAILHDIGAISLIERIKLIRQEESNPECHAILGYKLLKIFDPLKKSAYAIKFHHTNYNAKTNENIPLSSRIIMLSDFVATSINRNDEILGQAEFIKNKINEATGSIFDPIVTEAFNKEYLRPSFWLDIVSPTAVRQIKLLTTFKSHFMNCDELMKFAQFVAKIIDFRSRFTATHSSGVSAVAEYLGKLSGMNELECFELKIAGYLHDLGKLAISNEILEKPGKLTSEEFNYMRAHTFYTYRALEPFKDLSEINKTAAYHHEHLDGKGYPFGINANGLSKSSRIMAVADVFTALTEDRPYRKGMENPMPILKDMARHKLDTDIIKLVETNYESINKVRCEAQEKALIDYKNF